MRSTTFMRLIRVVHTTSEPEIVTTRQGPEDRPTPYLPGRGLERLPASRSGRPVRPCPDLCPHFFTSSKQSWLTLPAGARAVPVYDLSAVWPGRAFERHRLSRRCSQPFGCLFMSHFLGRGARGASRRPLTRLWPAGPHRSSRLTMSPWGRLPGLAGGPEPRPTY
jgi:hypothetical protein